MDAQYFMSNQTSDNSRACEWDQLLITYMEAKVTMTDAHQVIKKQSMKPDTKTKTEKLAYIYIYIYIYAYI